MSIEIHTIIEALVGAVIAAALWRSRYTEQKLDKLIDQQSRTVNVDEHRASMRGVYADVNALRERVARLEGPTK